MTNMTLEGHLSELRKRIIYITLFFVLSFVIGFLVSDNIVQFLKGDIDGLGSLNVFNPSSAIMIYMKVSFLFSLVLTLPFAIYQLWKFFSPGLTERERKTIFMYIPIAPILLMMGVLFAYYVVFPMMIKFMLKFTDLLGVNEVFGLSEYFTLMFNIVLPVGLLFELPVLIFILTHLQIITPNTLKKIRKYAYLILVIVASLITPPDLVTNILVSIPLFLLFELSIIFSELVFKKQIENNEIYYQEDPNKQKTL